MATITMDIEVYCDDCDTELSIASVNGETIYVSKCEHCADEAYNEGLTEGARADDYIV